MTDKYVIGIDLGTTTTLVAFCKGGKAEVLDIEVNNHIKETVMRLTKPILDESAEIADSGNSAWRNRKGFKEVTYSDFKPDIGEKESSNKLALLWLKAIYKKIKKRFNDADLSKYDVIIGVPANWSYQRRVKYIKIANQAGFKKVFLVPEPNAAVLATEFYDKLEKIEEDFYALFFDFGGGTLDLSLVQVKKTGSLQNIYSGGNPKLGGRDFDKALTYHFTQLARNSGKNITEEDEILIEENVKGAKTKFDEIDQPSFYVKGEIVKLSRDVFMEICKGDIDLIKITLDAFFEELMALKININKSNISEVIKIGGTSAMFFIDKLLRDYFNSNIFIDKTFFIKNPQKIVVEGLPLYLTMRDNILENIKPKIKSEYEAIVDDFNRTIDSYIINSDNYFESLFKISEDIYFGPGKANNLKGDKFKEAFDELTKFVLNKATNQYISDINLKLKDIAESLNLLLAEAPKFVQINFGSTHNKVKREISISTPKIPENIEEDLNIAEWVLVLIFTPIIIIYILSDIVFNKKIKRLKRDLKDNFLKYYSNLEPKNKRKDWRKNGGFFYQIKTKIDLPSWDEFWIQFEKNFNI